MTVSCKIVNLTPHPVNIYNEEESKMIASFPSSGEARCAKRLKRLGMLANLIPIARTEFRDVCGLPPKTEGTYYIVSRYVFNACPDRGDLLMPDMLVRDENGLVIGCKVLSIG
jgi:hypothetical protein